MRTALTKIITQLTTAIPADESSGPSGLITPAKQEDMLAQPDHGNAM
jgi:hypothetical protein